MPSRTGQRILTKSSRAHIERLVNQDWEQWMRFMWQQLFSIHTLSCRRCAAIIFSHNVHRFSRIRQQLWSTSVYLAQSLGIYPGVTLGASPNTHQR